MTKVLYYAQVAMMREFFLVLLGEINMGFDLINGDGRQQINMR